MAHKVKLVDDKVVATFSGEVPTVGDTIQVCVPPDQRRKETEPTVVDTYVVVDVVWDIMTTGTHSQANVYVEEDVEDEEDGEDDEDVQ